MGRDVIRCLVGDDHAALRRGVVELLGAEPDLEVVGEAGGGDELLALAARRRPHVTVADMRMPGLSGPALCEALSSIGSGTAVLVYSAHVEAAAVEAALEAGARGFLSKASPPQDLPIAVRALHAGGMFVDSMLAGAVLTRRHDESRPRLSPRETEVLRLFADGLTTDAAAASLYLSPATVRSYAETAMQKLESANRTHAVARALRLELIS
jgi:DNA-binding NarL/FixJ family response regulator